MSKEMEGRSIEEMRGVWTRRQVETMRSGEEAVLIVRDTKEYGRRRALPTLSGQRSEVDVGYDGEGNLYTTKWISKKTESDEEGRRFLVNPEGFEYVILSPKRPRANYLENLPLGKSVSELVIQKISGGVEAAIRQQEHVLARYRFRERGSEVYFATRVMGYVDSLADKYLSRKIDEETLGELARETGSFLEGLELVDPQSPEKRRILEMLIKVDTKDSLGRVNPLVARTRARAAYINAAKRLVIGGFVVEKINANLQVLSYEREITRWALRSAIRQLDFNLRGHSLLKRGFGETKLQVTTLTDVAEAIAQGHLSTPRVKPYLNPSREAIIRLTGPKDEEDKKVLHKFTDDETYSPQEAPVTELIREGSYKEADRAVWMISKYLRLKLEENEDIYDEEP